MKSGFFYAEVTRLLQEALTAHISERSAAFGEFLAIEADGIPRNALAEVQVTLASAEQDIKVAAMARIGGEREALERDCDTLTPSPPESTPPACASSRNTPPE
ncbi:hypothetical protein [Thiocystis minor]|uniref:hypothetical protein n=1 Tax=Thiocystis minor TaxID=61597 RepID=UPI001914CE8F|nr:hypothetical protein [Thiocystis minor]